MPAAKFKTRFRATRLNTPLSDELVTQQHLKDSTDINNVIRNHERIGILQAMPQPDPERDYTDTSVFPDTFHESMSKLKAAEQNFGDLPAHLRKRFENDPMKFLIFTEDKDNELEAAQLGLLSPKATELILLQAEQERVAKLVQETDEE